MGRDGAPRLRLVMVTDDDAGPRLCRGCGGPLMPSAKATALFCSTACRSRQWRRMRRARVKSEAAKAGVTASCPECGASWTVGVEHPASATYCSPCCRKTGLAQAAHAAERGVRPRIRRAGSLRAPGPSALRRPEVAGGREMTGCPGELTARQGVDPGPVGEVSGCPR